MLTLDSVSVAYEPSRSGSAAKGRELALDNVSLTLARGETLAVVGESGAGKSTLIAAILGLVQPLRGTVDWNAEAVRLCRPALVMQEPRSAFNPALRLRRSVLEPLTARGEPVSDKVLQGLCDRLDLPLDLIERYPHEVSIGQAQRVGILRALMSAPPLILFDEPLSALDAVTQKQTARLISELQTEHHFAALVVTHDLGYAAAHSDNIAVLRAGRVEELSPALDFVAGPSSDYGKRLHAAAVALGSLSGAAC